MAHRQYGGNLSGGMASLESATWLNRRPAARGGRSPTSSATALNPGCFTVAPNVPGSPAGATGITACAAPFHESIPTHPEHIGVGQY